MRLTRVHLYLLGGLMLAVVGPIVFSQQPDTGRGGKGKGKMRMDPGAMWESLAPGKDSINVNEVQFPPQMQFFADRLRQRMAEYLQTKGVTNGVMTKAQYMEYSEESRQKFSKGGGKGGGPPPTTPGAAPADTTPVDPKVEAAKIEDEARASFDKMDRNKDGVIDREEARGSRTLTDFDRWDMNKDGKISIDEYIEAFKARRSNQPGGGAVVAPGARLPPEEDRRPVVYRAGKLPKELPAWFALTDKDNDGQVGLYEWKAAGKPVIEFLAMDANGDGLLTVEEVLRFQKATNKDKQAASTPGAPTSGQGDGTQGRFVQGGWAGAAGGAAGISRGGRQGKGGRKGDAPGGGRSSRKGDAPGGGRGGRKGGAPGGVAPPAGTPATP